MHGYGRGLIDRTHDIAVDFLRDKRRVRRDQSRQRLQHGVQRVERRGLVRGHAARPVAFAAPPHVPVGQLVRKVAYRARRFVQFVIGQISVHLFDKAIEFAERPFVHERVFEFARVYLCRVEPVDLGVHDIKCVSVKQRAEEFVLRFCNRFHVEPRRQIRRGIGIIIPPHRVCARNVEH